MSIVDQHQSGSLAEEIARRAALRTKYRLMTEQTRWQPLPHQVPPEVDGSWNVWMLLGGRGVGKTRAGTEYVLKHLRELGPKARVGVGAPTIGDARSVCAEGESGLITVGGDEFTEYNKTRLVAKHVDGGVVYFMGAENPGRWNGPQWTLLWADELALWNEESWKQARFGVRLNPNPHIIVTTTPKARQFVKKLSEHPRTIVSSGSTKDNPHLAEVAVEALYEEYGGTRLGVQELEGKFLTEVEGALWKLDWIDGYRVNQLPPLKRVVVAVDPSGGSNAKTADDTGIAVVGLGEDKHFYVAYCQGFKGSPASWATNTFRLYDDYQADLIVAESNTGHAMVKHTLTSVLEDGQLLPTISTVHSKRGKEIRADPIAALYEQGRVHHLGVLTEAETQMCAFPVESEHDDLVDAIVIGITHLSGGKRKFRSY